MDLSMPRPSKADRCWDMVRRHYLDRGWRHAYRLYDEALAEVVGPGDVVLDAGCGRAFPNGKSLRALGANVVGVDPEADPAAAPDGTSIVAADLEHLPFESMSFSTVACRCVLEHLARPKRVFREFHRVLKPGGTVVFLTPNRYDYVSLGAAVLPHPVRQWLIGHLEGRPPDDAFPVYYRANTRRCLRRLAGQTGFEIDRLGYHNCYPAAFMRSPLLCRLGIAWDKLVSGVRWLNWLEGWLLGRLRRNGAGAAERDG